jgi:hypothetical protein
MFGLCGGMISEEVLIQGVISAYLVVAVGF